MENEELCNATTYDQYRVLVSRDGVGSSVVRGKSISIGRTAICFDSRYKCVTFVDADGDEIATAIGFPYLAGAGFMSDGARHTIKTVCSTTSILENALINVLAGSFIIISHGKLQQRLYLDPAGSMPIVFRTDTPRAGSTADAVFDDAEYQSRFDDKTYQSLVLAEGLGGWIPGYDTAHTGLKRLLPNHCLDLESWRAERHWPNSATDTKWLPPTESVEIICSALTEFCSASVEQSNVYSGLTAGQDTRLVLAGCRSVKQKMKFFTYHARDSQIDVDIARRISVTFGLNHEVFFPRSANAHQQAAWDRAVGHCVLEHNRNNHPVLYELPDDAVIFSGLYGEVGCCRLYRGDYETINGIKLDEKFVLKRLALPVTERTLQAVRLWLEPISQYEPSVILDLAFWELKFGGWAMSQRPAQGSIRMHHLPLAQRAILQTFVFTNPLDKLGSIFYRTCIRRLWPELADLPFNKYGSFQDQVLMLKKLFRPGRLRGFLRSKYKAR